MKTKDGWSRRRVGRWLVRIVAILLVGVGLMFYLGYGNPLPWMNPENSTFDNLWLVIFPMTFLGLIWGLKSERQAGWWLVLVLSGGFGATLLMGEEMPVVMVAPWLVGVGYLVLGDLVRGKQER